MTYFHSNLSLFRMYYTLMNSWTATEEQNHDRVIPIFTLNQFLSRNIRCFLKALKILIGAFQEVILWTCDFSHSLRVYLEIILKFSSLKQSCTKYSSFYSAKLLYLYFSQNGLIQLQMNCIIIYKHIWVSQELQW